MRGGAQPGTGASRREHQRCRVDFLFLGTAQPKSPELEKLAGKIIDFPFISSPSLSLLSGTVRLPLSYRLIKNRVGSLRDGSIISSPHRELRPARQLESQPGKLALPTPQHSVSTLSPWRGQEFSREGSALSPHSLGREAALWRPDSASSQLGPLVGLWPQLPPVHWASRSSHTPLPLSSGRWELS